MPPRKASTKPPRHGLGESWADAEYTSEQDDSLVSVSSGGGSASGSDIRGKPTPLPRKQTRASSATVQRASSSLGHQPARRSPRIHATAKGNSIPIAVARKTVLPNGTDRQRVSHYESPEQSLIMPTLPLPDESSAHVRSRISRRAGDGARKSSTQRPQSTRSSDARYDTRQRGSSLLELLKLAWVYCLQPLSIYTISVAQYAMATMKPIFGVVLAIFLLASMMSYLSSSIRSALSPICHVPGVSLLQLPFCSTPRASSSTPAPFDDLIKVQSTFEDVLRSSVDGFSLPVNMKRGEVAIRDLSTRVRFSSLPSKGELDVEFQNFVATAQQASRDLTTFNSRVGRAVDTVISTNRWTMHVLSDLVDKEANTGHVARFVSSVNPFSTASPRSVEEIVYDQYVRHTSSVEERLRSLINEAQFLSRLLLSLDEQLDNVANIAAHDGLRIEGNKDELLAFLWTKLGGNRSTRKKYEDQLGILREVMMYRNEAWTHVTATLLKLQAISAGLEDLRERVVAPAFGGFQADVPLLYYLDVVGQGIDRLQHLRGETRKIESDSIRNVLDAAEADELTRSGGGSKQSATAIPS